jgi:hypothetical protein
MSNVAISPIVARVKENQERADKKKSAGVKKPARKAKGA